MEVVVVVVVVLVKVVMVMVMVFAKDCQSSTAVWLMMGCRMG